jgi:hypothetical protein
MDKQGAFTAMEQVWELQPGYDFQVVKGDTSVTPAIPDITGIATPVEAWVVGRSFVAPNNNGAAFEGPAMDVSVYSTFIQMK